MSSQASSTAREGCASTTRCTPPRSSNISRRRLRRQAGARTRPAPRGPPCKWPAASDTGLRRAADSEVHLVGANPAELMQELQHQIRPSDLRNTARPAGRAAARPRGWPPRSPRAPNRGCSGSRPRSARSRTRRSRPATTRFNRVRSLIRAWYQGRRPRPAAGAAGERPCGAHENHELNFMSALIHARPGREEHGGRTLYLEHAL